MSKYRDHLAAQIRAALGPHNDPELPVVECVARLVAAQPAPGAEAMKHDQQCDRQYVAGFYAGWNAAIEGNEQLLASMQDRAATHQTTGDGE